MLQIWIGRAKSGKSAQALTEIRQAQKKRQILLVPEHASHQAELDLCRFCGDSVNLHAEVLSFSRLASRVLALTGGLSDESLDAGGKLLTMHAALQEAGGRLQVYRHPSQRVNFLKQLVSMADEFHAYHVTPEALWDALEDMPQTEEAEKLQDIARLYTFYEAYLCHDTDDKRDRLSKLAQQIGPSEYFLGKEIYIDGFSLFNALEQEVLRSALRQAEKVVVILLGDPEDRSEIFAQCRETEQMLLRLAQEEHCHSTLRYFASPMPERPLEHLERYFFGRDLSYHGECKDIILYEANDRYSEVEWVASQILQLVRSKDCRFRDITVAVRHLDQYEAVLENVLERYGIPAFLNRRSDLLEKPPLVLLTSALEAVTGGFEYEDVFRYLKTGLAGITPEECDQLENYVICWDLRGNAWLRDTPWTANPGGYGVAFDQRQQETLQQVNHLKDRVREPLLFLSRGLKEECTARGKTQVLYEFMEQLRLPQALEEKQLWLQCQGELRLAEEYAQVWQILCDVMDQFVGILGERELPAEEFSKLFRLILTQYSVGTIPAALDQVNVTEISRNDRHTVRHLFLLGANDSELPDVTSPAAVLNDEERQLLAQKNVRLAPSGMARFGMELQNIYAALAQPTETLTVTYSLHDGNGATLRPSFVISRILERFPAVKLQKESAEKYFRLTAKMPALEQLGTIEDPALWKYFQEDPAFTSRLRAMRLAEKPERGRLSPPMVRALYGERLSMTASRIDRIRSCHFAYFMQYGLRAKQRRTAKFSAPETGTFLHYLLENVTKELAEEGRLTRPDPELIRKKVHQYAQEYIRQELPDYQEKSCRFQYLFQRLERKAGEILGNVAEELSHSDFTPRAFELSFSERGPIPPVVLQQGQLQIRGKVDRVDGWERDGRLYLRVVDYKTGRKSFDLADLRYGQDMQMLLYLFALKKQGEEYFGKEIVPAGVMYLPARDEFLSAAHRLAPEEIYALRTKSLQRSGLLLDDPQILEAMEHGALQAPVYLPLKIGKNNEVQQGTASAVQFAQLDRYVCRVLQDTVEELREGKIDANPLAKSPQETPCLYCDFAQACHFQEGLGGDATHYRKAMQPEEFWSMLKEKEEGPWEANS